MPKIAQKMKVCFCGSGSGGHLKPLVALHLKMKDKCEGSFFLSTPHPFDSSFLREWNINAIFLKYTRISQGNLIYILWKVFYSLIETCFILKKEKPTILIGTGGYGCFPAYLACVLFSIDFYIIEPNSICGKVNKWFQSYAKTIFTHFPSVLGLKNTSNIKRSGVPLVYASVIPQKKDLIVIFGASLGARAINQFMKKYFEAYGGDVENHYIWITGKNDYEEFSYFNQHKNIEVYSFVKDMQIYLQRAKLIIARSGAGCIADVEYFKVPAIFIPYPYHSDRQQYLNTEYLSKIGSCIVWDESSLDSREKNRCNELKQLIRSEGLDDMKDCFESLDSINASDFILNTLKEC
ncbi:MAG: hypothetical protein COB02_08870 [Candidatus Cloacimonadota bacterium]|nr:MAG: hypothetical protein COB02_08870 [Candidatus Cloacimonadota bacterium]